MTVGQRILFALSAAFLTAGIVLQVVGPWRIGLVAFVASLWALVFVVGDMLADRIQGDANVDR